MGGAQPTGSLAVATVEQERTAFIDSAARLLLQRARKARNDQDSSLQYYDAKTNVRATFGVGIRSLQFDRMLAQSDQVSRVKWSRSTGASIEPLGARIVAPVGMTDLALTAPVPYWVGRDALWFPIDTPDPSRDPSSELLHPLAVGAEANYRYASGDSLTISVPNQKPIHLRELRVTARRPDWHAIVGTFWFDEESGNLVRAAYRLAADIDFWNVSKTVDKSSAETRLQNALSDTSANGRIARIKQQYAAEHGPSLLDRAVTKVMSGSLQPLRMQLTSVAIEYGLYREQFWLPRLRSANVNVLAGSLSIPASLQEQFTYDSIQGTMPGEQPLAAAGLNADSLLVMQAAPLMLPKFRSIEASDSLAARYAVLAAKARNGAEEAKARGDLSRSLSLLENARLYDEYVRQVARQRDGCAGDSTYVGGVTVQNDGALRTTYRLRCDPSGLATSPELPPVDDEATNNLFKSADREMLLQTLDLSLQPGWAPQAPELMTGISFLRYNRIEGLSVAGSVSAELGNGFTTRAELRYGFGDKVVNGELSMARTNGSSTRTFGIFHRLGIANPFGSPLSFGASLGNVLFARDEGFYYRTYGAEFVSSRLLPDALSNTSFNWRLFAERQRSAGVDPNTQGSLANTWGNARFSNNIAATSLSAFGVGGEVLRKLGGGVNGTRISTRVTAEAAVTNARDSVVASKPATSGYGRVLADATFSSGLGMFSGAVTTAAGLSAGDVPLQRSFFMGGLQTVRGQAARAEGAGRVGNALWMTRGEVGLFRSTALRPTVFFDAGWAGSRSDLLKRSRPLTGAGAGVSVLDGLIRFDAARGIWPEKRWRYALYMGARF